MLGAPRFDTVVAKPLNRLQNNFYLEKVLRSLFEFWAGVDDDEQSCNINVDEILTKVTLLSFGIVTSHNYAPLRCAIHALETLQEVFFWDGVQKPCHVSFDAKNIVKSLSFQSEFESWE
ncbi:hypothetical protein TNCV_4668021 [Trichonephila clavipes]|nr:hypothetical protein TNCV_4668021 [Trichonephila clavipes]